jgi:hypothetical protein
MWDITTVRIVICYCPHLAQETCAVPRIFASSPFYEAGLHLQPGHQVLRVIALTQREKSGLPLDLLLESVTWLNPTSMDQQVERP